MCLAINDKNNEKSLNRKSFIPIRLAKLVRSFILPLLNSFLKKVIFKLNNSNNTFLGPGLNQDLK